MTNVKIDKNTLKQENTWQKINDKNKINGYQKAKNIYNLSNPINFARIDQHKMKIRNNKVEDFRIVLLKDGIYSFLRFYLRDPEIDHAKQKEFGINRILEQLI